MVGRPELLSLLAACRDQYADDVPRRVVADWLEEHGDEADLARAEAIRLQLSDESLAGQPLHNSRLRELSRRFRSRWLGELGGPPGEPGPWPQITLDRGFWRVVPPTNFYQQPQIAQLEGEALAWVGEVNVWFSGGALPAGLLQTPLPSSVPGVVLIGPSGHVEALGGLRDWHALRSLEIADSETNYNVLERLAGLPHPVQELRLHGGHYGPADAGCLDGGSAFAGVSRFAMRDAQVDWGRGALARSTWRRRLASLRLEGCSVSGVVLVSDLLEELFIRRCNLPPQPLASLSAPERLRRLALRECSLGDQALAEFAVLRLAGVRLFDLSRNRLTSAGLSALADAPLLRPLEAFVLDHMPLGEKGGLALASLPAPPRLRLLSLEGCALGEGGAEALAGWPGLAAVEVLNLENNHIGPAAAQALAEANMGRLRHLDLAGNNLGDKGVMALLASPLLDGLGWLSLRSNRLGRKAALALAASPRLGRLRHLSLWGAGNSIPDEARAALRERFGPNVAI
jgi:uncharacterized protein (TIGR02996 family)